MMAPIGVLIVSVCIAAAIAAAYMANRWAMNARQVCYLYKTDRDQVERLRSYET